jgi:hypothetical protein
MMNRRGLVRAHSHWRPGSKATRQLVSGSRAAPGRNGRRIVAAAFAAIAFVGVGFGVRSGLGGVGSSHRPTTATAWLDSFTAAAARDPQRLCSELVTSTFRAAIQHDVRESCVSYYSRIQGEPIRILRILQTGDTAALEIRYWPRGPYSTFVLDRAGGGWRAVAIVPGGPLPVA